MAIIEGFTKTGAFVFNYTIVHLFKCLAICENKAAVILQIVLKTTSFDQHNNIIHTDGLKGLQVKMFVPVVVSIDSTTNIFTYYKMINLKLFG